MYNNIASQIILQSLQYSPSTIKSIKMKLKDLSTFYLLSVLAYLALVPQHSYSQITRDWEYSYNPINNYEASGQSITVLPSGKTITAGLYKSSTGNNKNAMLFLDESGAFLDVDTSNPGFGYRKVIYDGKGNVFAAATLSNDSLPINKTVVARFDTTFSNRQFFIPDSTTTFPGYDVLDMSILSNSTIVVASHWDAFPLVNLSLICMDSTGIVLWERVDSIFEFGYDVKLLADSSGGVYVAGSGRDTSTSINFIFISHYSSTGVRDWFVKQYSSQSFADMNDIIMDVNKNLYVSGTVMDSTGQVGILMKLDTLGNVLWDKPIQPLSYLRLTSDDNGNIYGAVVPQNGIDVLTIEKLDSSGTFIISNSYQNSFYFTSDLGDFRMLKNGIIAATGGLYVLSFPKTDLFFVALDTSLNILGNDIYNSINLLGEKGHAMCESTDGNVYVCGRFNFENQFETSNIGVAKYDLSGLINGITNITSVDLEIFPNPSIGNFTMRWRATPMGKINIQIFNSLGMNVFNDAPSETLGQIEYHLNLIPGIYHAVVETDHKRIVTKISIVE